jgi:hypothetical protein
MGHWAAWTLVGLLASACASNGSAVSPAVEGGSEGGNSVGGSGGTGPVTSTDANTGGEQGQDTGPMTGDDAGNGTDVGASDAVDGDAATDGGTGCPPGALLCDDFEGYAAVADFTAAWKPATTAATMTVDSTKAFAGGKALHIKGAAGTPSAVIVKDGAPLFPISGNVMWGRVMLWLTATPGGDYHMNSIQAAGTIPGSTQWGKYGWGVQAGKVLAGYTVRDTPSGAAIVDCSKPSAMAFPDQRWVCVEWEFDSAKNEMHMWFDSTLLADADVIGKGTRCVNNADLTKPWTGPAFSNLTLGWQQYQASSGALELWMDDLAIGPQRIGCPKP